MDNDYGRIHRLPFKAVTSVLFTAAILATIGRVIIRLQYQTRLSADDYVLLFGCSSLVAAFTLINVMFESLFFHTGLLLGSVEPVLQELTSAGFEKDILVLQRLVVSNETMCWITVFAVKISYLLFFRHLLNRMKSHLTYWTVTMCIVIVSGIFCICNIFILCPQFGVSAIKCTQGKGFRKSLIITEVSNALNILTDLFIIAVPISLLWKVNIRLHQKVILGTFLCLSVFIIAVCLVRAAGQINHGRAGKFIDVQWSVFWRVNEASVAVIVVSLTAFRSLYGIKTLQQEREKKQRYEPWLFSTYRKNLFRGRKQTSVDELGNLTLDEDPSLPSIPGATFTGMRTMISGMRTKLTQTLSGRGDAYSVDETQEKLDGIKVVTDFDMHESFRSSV